MIAGDIARLLILLNDADQLLRSFEGEYSDWVQPAESTVVVVEVDEAYTKRMRLRGGGPRRRAIETRRRIWFERPDRMRVELAEGNRLLRLAVRDRETWWRWDHTHGADTGSAKAVGGVSTMPALLNPQLFTPASLIGTFRFEPTGVGRRLGRDVLLAVALPRETPPTATELTLEFEFDMTHGTVLRRAAFENGRCVQITEVVAAKFDASIDAERFVFDPPEA